MCTAGLFCDVVNGVEEGACGPVLIHADKSKAKEKEAQEEQVRQCNGETPTNTLTCSEWWTVRLINLPDVLVQTTASGSMTQEVFMMYARHFVESLPPNHGPVILFLDGHASCWNHYALKYFMDNKVFTFFLQVT